MGIGNSITLYRDCILFNIQIRELLLYIEPRVKNYVKDCDVKDNWLGKIDKFKERYKQIVS